MSSLRLCVGLGNPGQAYEQTRHNVGVWWLEAAVTKLGGSFREMSTCFGRVARINIGDEPCFFLLPNTYVNESGRAVAATCRYFKLPTESVLLVYDDLDFPAGTARLKAAGGAGGHNGVSSVIKHLKTDQFHRLRLGIGRPIGPAERYVLASPGAEDKQAILAAIQASLACLPNLLAGEWEAVMAVLHQEKGG